MHPKSSALDSPGVGTVRKRGGGHWWQRQLGGRGEWGQVGASVRVEKHEVPLNLFLEPIKQNSFTLCVGATIAWDGALNSNGSLQAQDEKRSLFEKVFCP